MSEAPLLEADRLVRHFRTPQGRVQAVDGVSLTIGRGEAVALVGESGSGKSTLARMLVCLDRPTGGTLRFGEHDLTRGRGPGLRAVRRRVSMVFQDPYASLDGHLSIGRSVEEPMLIHRIGTADERAAKVAELLDAVGLDPEMADRRPAALSGGQRQRVAIARAIALDPELVVLDEPVSALDVSVQAQVLNLLADLRERYGLAYLFVSHDLGVVRHVAERTAVMQLGRIVEQGPTEQLFAQPRHPYTIALLSSAMEIGADERRIALEGEPPSPLRPPSGCRFRTRCFRADAICAEADPALEEEGGRGVACHHPGPLAARELAGRT